jgi:hypothetical protein
MNDYLHRNQPYNPAVVRSFFGVAEGVPLITRPATLLVAFEILMTSSYVFNI